MATPSFVTVQLCRAWEWRELKHTLSSSLLKDVSPLVRIKHFSLKHRSKISVPAWMCAMKFIHEARDPVWAFKSDKLYCYVQTHLNSNPVHGYLSGMTPEQPYTLLWNSTNSWLALSSCFQYHSVLKAGTLYYVLAKKTIPKYYYYSTGMNLVHKWKSCLTSEA